MNADRLQALLQIHNEFVRAASLPEPARPYSVQSRLEKIQVEIMKETEQEEQSLAPQTKTTDDIPF